MKRMSDQTTRLAGQHPGLPPISHRPRRTVNLHGLRLKSATPVCGTANLQANPIFGHGGNAAVWQHLNGFFAISVNSPSMSIVNFFCCVGAAPLSVCGVTRRVTPQPMRAAVRMDAGDHARL
jgi:hypothetical protein